MPSLSRAASLQAYRALSGLDFLKLLCGAGKYKQRSEQTHDQVHGPLLADSPPGEVGCLLLGDSMFERFKTTGKHTKLGQVGFPKLLNAGVGGDKTSNVLYRLGAKELYAGLKQRGIKLSILHMGSNDLTPKRGLTAEILDEYGLALETLRRVSPEVVILVTGIFQRKDVGQGLVDQSNLDLQQLVEDFNNLDQTAKVHYIPPDSDVTLDKLVDHAHLNEEAYEIFARTLLRKVDELGLMSQLQADGIDT
ncbi:SGNH hydrolase [Glonium stellatum]|uniref:SGNH hydrolase n=1 Tax=Glonium stellatum TaxID=574774 RepID=A0A8E2F0H6_9PEZI|nr:SGNH hydrolase [Glonium stellatum]